jgi:8-oxo-dGTP pyrophosphatase MutT (NUDIX family)
MTSKINVVKVLLRNDEGKFLVVKERESGQWEHPGGIIEEEQGEDRFEAARREVKEEVNLRTPSFSDVVRVEVDELREEKETVNCWIMFTDEFSGEIELEERELEDYRWVDPDEFRDMDWHADAGYGLPPMVYLEKYL